MPRHGVTFEIAGLMRADGVTPLSFPFDPERWLTDFYPQILAHRIRVARETQHADEVGLLNRAIQRGLCAHDSVEAHAYYLLTFGWIHEPRNPPDLQDLPFILHPRQLEFLITLHEVMHEERGPLSSLAVEKSREVGATWMDASHNTWGWQFLSNWSSLLLSIDGDSIDREGNPGTWFFKHDYLLKRQPSWLLPNGFRWDSARAKRYRTDKMLRNPATDAVILGTTNTPEAGRGTRYYKVSLDEAGYDRNFEDHWHNTYAVADHRVAYSTATRRNPAFYRLIHGKDGWKQPVVFRLEWNTLVTRDVHWLRAARDSMSDAKFRQEVLIDYEAEISGWTYDEFREKGVETLRWHDDWTAVVGLDDGYDDDTALVVGQLDPNGEPGTIQIMASFQKSKRPIRFYATLLSGNLRTDLFDYDTRDLWFAEYCRQHLHREGAPRTLYYGDRHGDQTNFTDGNTPWGILLEEYGIAVDFSNDPAKNERAYRQDALKEQAKRWRFHDGDGAPEVLEAIQLTHYAERKITSNATYEQKGPVHDSSSHLTTACQYIVINHLDRPEPEVEELARNILAGGLKPISHGRRRVSGEHILWMQQ